MMHTFLTIIMLNVIANFVRIIPIDNMMMEQQQCTIADNPEASFWLADACHLHQQCHALYDDNHNHNHVQIRLIVWLFLGSPIVIHITHSMLID